MLSNRTRKGAGAAATVAALAFALLSAATGPALAGCYLVG